MSTVRGRAQTSYATTTLRPNSHGCCARDRGVAWMSFQKHREDGAPVRTAMSWPLTRPAGVSSLEIGCNRRPVSTKESRSGNLPPINNNIRPGNRKVGFKSETHDKGRPSWANNWANIRAQQTNVYTNGATGNSDRKGTSGLRTNSGVRSIPRKNTEIVATNEKEAMLFKRLKGIYANSTDRTLRAQQLQNSINLLQSRTMHTEIAHSLSEYKKKVENDKRNRSELKRVRDRYLQDKERRKRHSYVSLTALECPHVSRHAYGLPEEGQELSSESGVTQSTQNQLRHIWQKAMKRATLVDKFIQIRKQEKVPFPEITVRSRPPRPKRSREEHEKDSFGESAQKLELMLGEIDAMSSDDDDDLKEIEEEDEY